MKRALFLLFGCLLAVTLAAQEQLAPLRVGSAFQRKSADSLLALPFFDDFSRSVALYGTPWQLQGAWINQGYAPLPPTIGMATLDAYDAFGCLYPAAPGALCTGDTLLSPALRLDSLFAPYARALTAGDSIYLSFYFLPGGGSGNMWERIGDCPNPQDSLLLEFYCPQSDRWRLVWAMEGVSVDSLVARTGSAWQYVQIPILDSAYLQPGFRFRFRNYFSLDNVNKVGQLGNADQWNLDYVMLDVNRRRDDRFTRDVAFVNPAPSFLNRYQAMPARQFQPSDMLDTVSMTITNLFSQPLAANYGYQVLQSDGSVLFSYEGGLDNVPVYWPAQAYQTSSRHASPSVDFVYPVSPYAPTAFTVVHGLREGVSGDPFPQNDSVSFRQVFDNYYAYDDGTAENGYGITSTSRPRLACSFTLHAEDTLTAVDLYFNHTYDDGNSGVRFLLTVWDDAQGHPGSVIYQDEQRRRPQFDGFNRYVRYALEQPLVCSGTIYVGLEQVSSDYINLGFDRNCDASDKLFYLTSAEWQRSILRGALMLRPCFGSQALAVIPPAEISDKVQIIVRNRTILVEHADGAQVRVYDALGRRVGQADLRPGIYLVRVGDSPARKVVIY